MGALVVGTIDQLRIQTISKVSRGLMRAKEALVVWILASVLYGVGSEPGNNNVLIGVSNIEGQLVQRLSELQDAA